MMVVKGYRGRISRDEVEKMSERGIYVVNALCVGGREHLIHSYLKARDSMEKGRNIAKKLHIELMLILSGRRQIKEALKLCGTDEANELAAISEEDFELPLERDDSVLKCSEEKIRHLSIDFCLPGKECEALFENSALLELER